MSLLGSYKSSGNDRRFRVLQVVTTMNRGGVETWIMHILRNIDRSCIQMDILVHTDVPCAYDEEAQSLGAKILRFNGLSKNPLRYKNGFRAILAEQEAYDVIHCHIHWFAAVIMYEAARAKIPVRIAYSHSDNTTKLSKAGPGKRLAYKAARYLICKYSTHRLACSIKAGNAYFGRKCEWRPLYCGIDLAPFRESVNKSEFRESLNLPEDALVLGHVGNFSVPKNIPFLIDVFAEVSKKRSDAYLLLVGDGPFRMQAEERIWNLGIQDKVVFTGFRSDISRLMMAGMDIFMLPSLREGMPLVAIEAQAAGLKCFISDVISKETDVVHGAVERLSLGDTPAYWAEQVLSSISQHPLDASASLEEVEKSPFNISNSLANLLKIYKTQILK